MALNYETTLGIRIVGIAFSIVALLVLVFKPFYFITNIALVYGFLLAAALAMICGQAMVLLMRKNEETATKNDRYEVIYDLVTTSVVVVLFTSFYVVPFVMRYVG
jgi:uncharacterized membrane protein SpoIIM required for sporulation